MLVRGHHDPGVEEAPTPLGAHRPFAVPAKDLREAGIAENDLGWLVQSGYVEYTTESKGCDGRRDFLGDKRETGTKKRIQIMLTERGATWVRKFSKVPPRRQGVLGRTPRYERLTRELRVGALVLKRFRQPAEGEEWLLLAFEEQGWQLLIDDPLPRKPGGNPKQHLHDTIHNLNRNQNYRLIQFYGDGTGQRVGWKWRR